MTHLQSMNGGWAVEILNLRVAGDRPAVNSAQERGSALSGKTPFRASDLRGLNRLVIDATADMTDVVEAMHHNIARVPGAPSGGRTRGVTGLVYRSIRGITRLVGGVIDAALAPFAPWERGDPRLDAKPGLPP